MSIDPGDLADLWALKQRQATNEKISALAEAEKIRKQEAEILASRKEILFNAIKILDGAKASLSARPIENIFQVLQIEDDLASYSIVSSSFDTVDFKVLADKAWSMLYEVKERIKTNHKSTLLYVETEKVNAQSEIEQEMLEQSKSTSLFSPNLFKKNIFKGTHTYQVATVLGLVFLISCFLIGLKILNIFSISGMLVGYFAPSILAFYRSGKSKTLLFIANLLFPIGILFLQELNIKFGVVYLFLCWIILMSWAFLGKQRQDFSDKEENYETSSEIKRKVFERLEAKLKQRETLLLPSSSSVPVTEMYHIAKGQTQIGLITKEQITEMLIDGKLSLDDYYFNENECEWKRIREMRNLDFFK